MQDEGAEHRGLRKARVLGWVRTKRRLAGKGGITLYFSNAVSQA